ncbi:Crp/Fnr family transcriptional regulator [Flavobacterium silvaticum]|uniref:Crp/Fnr family transcriptional regulator n=1 Tax=Flavobacterium silvaticum TaxID=1852020 RepID=A0A972JJX7_9FLAO|nr:Crp/Fnr family transcriptional regulator [Flavobacterium silvaticum]NMH28557.1 Crp/Fnr family transcriptional regulator [Flavobacterium silvaticum]
MHDLLFQNITKHISLTQDEQTLLKSKILSATFDKNQIILEPGNHSNQLYFVKSGCLRVFQPQEDGQEINVLFCPENWWACDILSFSDGKPATFGIDCLESTEVCYFTATDMDYLYGRIPKLERFFRILFQNAFALYQRRLALLLSTSAETRYKLFKTQYPTLEARIAQKHIASYLGITPVFLSMLRKKKL